LEGAIVISSLHDAAIFFIKWKQEETVLDVFITMLDCGIESCAVLRHFRGDWLELATNSDATLIRIFLPNIVRYEFLAPEHMPVINIQRQPAPRIKHGWLLSTREGVGFQISELDDPASQIGGSFQA
jgi:hypothetical protein